MTYDEKHAIALMRYSAIAPIINETLEPGQSLRSFYVASSMRSFTLPNGQTKQFCPDTFEHWYRLYKRKGFDGLLPSGRKDAGKSRCLDDESKDYIRYMKESYPRMPASTIYKQMLDNGIACSNNVSESTVNRFVNQFMADKHLTNNRDMRRYERPHINEVWCGDSSVGPRLLVDGIKKKIYIIALIDDASRFIVGIDVFFNDTFVSLMSVIKSAVSKYGRPKTFNFDNGSAYKNKQMELLAARIGSTINYCQPYTPTSKAKIERWFRTLKDHWMASLDMRTIHNLDELRSSLWNYVNEYNQTPHSALASKSPMDRFFSEPDQIRRLDPFCLDHSFLLEIERTVSSDCVIVIDHTEYEVDYRFAKRRIRLRYSPDLSEIFVVEADNSLLPIKLLNKQENAMIHREKVYLCRGDEA